MKTFHTQGAVPIGSQSYIPRVFENKIRQEVFARNWVLLLGPRQHGKSSALVRLRQEFQENGFLSALVDLQALAPCQTFQLFLKKVTDQICRSLNIQKLTYPDVDSQDDFVSWLRVNIPQNESPIVIMIDEAANIQDDLYRNSFYGQIRQISSLRAESKPSDIPSRITFVFSGTFRPETLISEQNSPFNVCQMINTEDISIHQAHQMTKNINNDLVVYVNDIFDLVGGQPYLIQKILSETEQYPLEEQNMQFKAIITDLQYIVSQHLESLFSKIVLDINLINKVSLIVQSGFTPLLPADSDCTFLQTIGLARREGANLIFRNNFYSNVARQHGQLTVSQSIPSTGTNIIPIDKKDLSFMNNHDLMEIAFSAYNGGKKSHNSGSYRLALVGFGSATEAILIDFLSNIPTAELETAINNASLEPDPSNKPNFARSEVKSNISSWRLVNLINITRKIQIGKGKKSLEPSHALRHWRNLVHPAEAIKNFIDESMLESESILAASLFVMLVRDIKLYP